MFDVAIQQNSDAVPRTVRKRPVYERLEGKVDRGFSHDACR